jgi:hypothetical protein
MTTNTPPVFDVIIQEHREGTIDIDTARKRIADAIKADPSLREFKDKHLAWTDYDDAVEWWDWLPA